MSANGINLLTNNYSTRNIFVWNNRFNSITATFTDGGSGTELLAGMLIGRISSTGKVQQCISTATDGSQIPIGVLTQNYTVAASESVDISICIQGDVDYGMLVFGGSPQDTIASNVSTNSSYIGTLGDVLNGKGILPIVTTEMTYEDNQ